jgi:hypothetical protein
LIDGHLDGQLLQTFPEGDGETLLNEYAAQPATASRRSDEHPQFANVPRP